MATAPATQLYQKLERIGRGSFGEVYKAVVIQTGELVAIKQLDLDSDEDDIEEIRKEIAVLSRCDSPYVTKYWGSYLVETKLWIVMDFAGGGSIRSIMKAGPLNEKCIFLLALEACSALAYLHRNGIIHRDIKAANILLTDDGHVKVCDFGVAGQVTSSTSRRNSFVGTPFWMAPEVIKRMQYDFKADIWSFGITVYEMANGNPPYVDQDPMKAVLLISRNHPPRLEGQQYSKLLKELVESCLNDVPDDRPSAEDLLKSKFFRAMRPSPATLRDLVVRHQDWMATLDHSDAGQDTFTSPTEQETIGPWAFDTVKTAPIHHDSSNAHGESSPKLKTPPPSTMDTVRLKGPSLASTLVGQMEPEILKDETIRDKSESLQRRHKLTQDTAAAASSKPRDDSETDEASEGDEVEDGTVSQGTSTPIILDVTPNTLSSTVTPQRRTSDTSLLSTSVSGPISAKTTPASMDIALNGLARIPMLEILKLQQSTDQKQIAAAIADATDLITTMLQQTQKSIPTST